VQRELPDLVQQVAIGRWPDDDGTSNKVAQFLEEAGAQGVFFDPNPRLPSSRSLLAASRGLVIVLTDAATSSEELRQEIRFARQQGKACALVQGGGNWPSWAAGQATLLSWPPEGGRWLDALLRSRADLAPNMAPPLPAYYVER